MPVTDQKAPRNGWKNQAEHLAVKHTAVAWAATAGHDRQRPSLTPVPRLSSTFDAESQNNPKARETAPLPEIELSAAYAERDKERLQKAVPARIVNARRETLAARAVMADGAIKRLAELEAELDAAQERAVRRDNENQSLQMSLNLLVSDNLRLSKRLAETGADVDDLRSQLDKTKLALTVAEVERDKLALAAAASNEKQGRLNAHLDFTSASLVVMEKRFTGARQDLLARNADNGSLAHQLAEAGVVRQAAELKLESLRNSLAVKERQFRQLEQSRAQLLEGMSVRDLALSRAQDKIKTLAELVAQIELKAKSAPNTDTKIAELNPRRQDGRQAPVGTEGEHSKQRTNTILQCELDNDQWLLVGRSSRRLT